jgi:hypothetical protein
LLPRSACGNSLIRTCSNALHSGDATLLETRRTSDEEMKVPPRRAVFQ